MLFIITAVSLINLKSVARKGIQAVDGTVFKARTFFYNVQHFFDRETYLKPQNQNKPTRGPEAVLAQKSQTTFEATSTPAPILINGDINTFQKETSNNNETPKTENKDENKLIEKNEENNIISQNSTTNETDANGNQVETNYTVETKVETEENKTNSEDPNLHNKIKSTKIPENLHYSDVKSIISEIKSPIETKPAALVRGLKTVFISFQNADAGKNGDYWEIHGKNANFTMQFESNLIVGIRLWKTDRKCELKQFQILDPQKDYELLHKVPLTESGETFEFANIIRTNSLKLSVIENQGDEELTCLYNYTLIGIV